MRWRQSLNINVFSLVLVIFVLSLDISEAQDPNRRIASNDKRAHYAKTQNDRRISYHKKMLYERRVSTIKKIINYSKNPTFKSIVNRRTFSSARKFVKQKSTATAKKIYDNSIPDSRRILLNRRALLARRTQNARHVPITTVKQDTRNVKIRNGKVQANRDKILQKEISISYNKRAPMIRENVRKYEKMPPSYRRVPGISRLQYDKEIQTDNKQKKETMRPDNDITISDQIIQPDRIIDIDKRMKINKLLEEDRMQHSILRRKMDSIIQNDKLVEIDGGSPTDRYNKRIQEERRILQAKRLLNARRIQNVRKYENVRKLQDKKRIFEENNKKIANFRRIRNDRRMWVVTPAAAVFRRFIDNSTLSPESPVDFNSSEVDDGEGEGEQPEQDDGGAGSKLSSWARFFQSLIMIFEGLSALPAAGTEGHKVRACLHIATTYMSAHKDLRRYMELRYFYENNLQYEVGYMTSEIISKYQRMLEIYHIAQEKWYKHQAREFVSSIYMLYLYTNVLEMGTVIGHLCSMLNELEDRFRVDVPKSGFSDYHIPKKPLFVVNGTDAFESSISDYEKRLLEERRKRQKQRKKERNKNLYAGYKPTPPDRRPRASSWPLIYGWSIEYNW